jgi:DNA-binding FadR family transcriptional regulator
MQPDRKRGESRRHFAVQRAILALVLAGDPVARTRPELAREFGDSEAVRRAVASLQKCGLLEVRGGESQSLWPTNAARQAHRLEAW